MTSSADQELDVRPLRKPDKHPTIFATYQALPVDGSFVLINDHAGSFRWEYLNTEVRDWRIRITKLAATPLPRVLVNTDRFTSGTAEADVTGAAWKLQVRERDLDSNIIALTPGGTIEAHNGPNLDVLIHVLAGSGRLTTELGGIDLEPGALLWLPRRARRQFTAGPDGLRYLTVHQRRQALVLDTGQSGTARTERSVSPSS